MRSAKYLSSAILAALLLEQPLAASMYVGSHSFVHPKITSGQMTIHSVCILPAKGEVMEIAALKRQPDVLRMESEQWSRQLLGLSIAHLQSAGLTTAVAARPDGPAENLQQSLLSLQQSFDAIYPQLEKKPKDIAKDSYTLGADVAKLPCAATSDALIFVEADFKFPSVGRAALGAFSRVDTSDIARFNLAVVNAKSGEVVGFLHIENVMPHLDDAERTFGVALDKELMKMNLVASAGNP